jgi:FkbM family methyltransferase
MLITFLFLSFDKILYILKKIRLYKYLPSYITNNRFFENCISYINPKYIFFFKLKDMIYEYPSPIIIATFIKEGDIVIDIGANQGQYTMFLSKLVGEKGKVYAFEPDPRNFLILKHRTRKFKNVIIERSAVDNKKSKVKFYLDKFMGMPTIYKDASVSPIKCLEIDMVNLDDYFQDLKGDIALIKMDVQGSEPLVLDGMKNLIKKVKVLIFEFWPLGIKAAGLNPFSFIEKLISNNFKLIYIDENFNSFNINEIYDKINDIYI